MRAALNEAGPPRRSRPTGCAAHWRAWGAERRQVARGDILGADGDTMTTRCELPPLPPLLVVRLAALVAAGQARGRARPSCGVGRQGCRVQVLVRQLGAGLPGSWDRCGRG